MPTTAIPTAEQSNLNADVCKQSPTATLCIPKEMIAPGFKPTTCTATSLLTFLTGGYSGVCLVTPITSFGAGSGLALARKGTATTSTEMHPCTNPLTNAPTGAPGCPGVDGGL